MLHEYDDSVVLSICIMSYNRGHMLIDAIQEMLKYESDDIEIVISDNASTDGTWESLKEIQDKRMRIYRNDENMGMSYNATRLWALAGGKYIMQMTDRDRLNMKELPKIVRVLQRIDKDVISAQGIKYLKSDIATYQQRVYESTKNAAHPGWWIYSRALLEKADDKLHGKWFSRDPIEQAKIGYCVLNLRCQSNKWFCYYGQPLIIRPSLQELVTVRSNRVGNSVMGQIYFGLDARISAFELQIETTNVNRKQMVSFIKGVYAGNVFRIFQEYYWTINQPELCKRYNYIPPKHIWWLRNGMEFCLRARKYLVKNGKCNKELEKYLYWEMWKQYIEFKKGTGKMIRLLRNVWKSKKNIV